MFCLDHFVIDNDSIESMGYDFVRMNNGRLERERERDFKEKKHLKTEISHY